MRTSWINSTTCEVIFDLDKQQEELEKIEKMMARTDFWQKNQQEISKANQQGAHLREQIDQWHRYFHEIEDAKILAEMAMEEEDESVLIHNAGGGVGLAALDIAKKIGAATFGTSSRRKHDFLKERGLDYPIDYREDDWEKELKKLAGGKGMELIIDPIGGSHWKKSYRALRATGRLGVFGISEVAGSGFRTKLRLAKTFVRMPSFHAISMMKANKGVFGVDIGNLWNENEKMRSWMKAILKGVEEGWIRPHVDKAFSFEDAGKAHAYIEGRKNIGKVVLVP